MMFLRVYVSKVMLSDLLLLHIRFTEIIAKDAN